MRKPILILSLMFSVMLSSPSYAEWEKVGENIFATIYVDFERIRKHGGFVYYWTLQDYLRPNKFGDFSGKVYNQGDCKLFRFKKLSYVFHKEPMGGGSGDTQEPVKKGWFYPAPRSGDELILKKVCAR